LRRHVEEGKASELLVSKRALKDGVDADYWGGGERRDLEERQTENSQKSCQEEKVSENTPRQQQKGASQNVAGIAELHKGKTIPGGIKQRRKVREGKVGGKASKSVKRVGGIRFLLGNRQQTAVLEDGNWHQ